MKNFLLNPWTIAIVPFVMPIIASVIQRFFGIKKGEKNINQTHYGSGDNIAGDKITQEMQKYSKTQIVQISSSPGNYNEYLNLNNIAWMSHVDCADLNSIDMILLESALLRVENPTTNREYKIDDNYSVTFPNTDSFNIKNATIGTMGSKKFTFDRFNQKTQIIEIEGKKFVVTLQNILDKSNREQKLIEYIFGITENNPTETEMSKV
jgi:hypothetical protein